MLVRKLRPEDVVTTSRDRDLGEITQTLDDENIGAVVVTEDHSPVGIVTDRDTALQIHDNDPSSAPVEEVMTEDPATIHEDEVAIEIPRPIPKYNMRRFPIVDNDGDLTGIATLDDLVATIGEQLDNVSETIEAQSPEYSP